MSDERNDILLSQFVDGELPSDRANELLLSVLDVPAERERLNDMLRLRQVTVGWRTRQPPQPALVVAERLRAFRRGRSARRLSGLAVAACIGGLLVLSGIWAAGWLGRTVQPGDSQQIVDPHITPPAVAHVSIEQMRQVAKVFALHESVAGPLAWYAADDQNIRLASAKRAEVSQAPIGVLLTLQSATADTAARTLVIVCRNDQPAIIEIPTESSGRAGLRVYLTPRTINGKVDVQYAIAVGGESQQPPLASLSGRRRLGLSETPLGQLAMGDRVLNIGAAAWPIRGEHN